MKVWHTINTNFPETNKKIASYKSLLAFCPVIVNMNAARYLLCGKCSSQKGYLVTTRYLQA